VFGVGYKEMRLDLSSLLRAALAFDCDETYVRLLVRVGCKLELIRWFLWANTIWVYDFSHSNVLSSCILESPN
jgi:hypothetical protein